MATENAKPKRKRASGPRKPRPLHVLLRVNDEGQAECVAASRNPAEVLDLMNASENKLTYQRILETVKPGTPATE